MGKAYFDNKSITPPTPNSGGTGISYTPIVYEPATEEDYARLEQILPQNEIIQKLPENARILLSFYNFDNGERQWEKNYLLTKGNAIQTEMINDVDMKLIIHSKYLSRLDASNFCAIINNAQNNGDFATELIVSKVSLLWKYKSIMSYKDCLGL